MNEITMSVLDACVRYYVKKKFSVHLEFGLIRRGRLRLDLVALDMRSNLVGIEVKTSYADFKRDKKFEQYLEHVDKLYIAVPNRDCAVKIAEELNTRGLTRVGVFCVERNLVNVKRAEMVRVVGLLRKRHITKMAWRNGINCAKLRIGR